jgi:hypothetical protein
VRACLDRGQCPVGGMGSSVPPFMIGVTWSHLRATLEWLGLGLAGAHAAFQALEALMVVLVAATADRVAGRLAALAGAALAVVLLLHADLHLAVVYNNRPLPFLGALVAGLAILAAEGAWVPSLLAAVVAGVMTDLHPVCGLLLPSLVGVAAMRRDGRWTRAIAVGMTFALTAFLASPGTWILAALGAASGGMSPGATSTASGPTILESALVLAAAGAGVAASLPRSVGIDRGAAIAIVALLVPQGVAHLAARTAGLASGDKYLLDLLPAIALGIATGAAGMARVAAGAITAMAGNTGPWASRASGAAPYLFAAGLAAWPVDRATAGSGVGRMLVEEADALAAAIPDALAQDQASLALRLRGPEAAEVIDWIHARGTAVTGSPARSPEPLADPHVQAIALRIPPERVPERLPDQWRVIRRDDRAALVLGLLPTRIDWGEMEICDDGAGAGATCAPAFTRVPGIPEGAVTVDGLPRRGTSAPGSVTRRLALRLPPPGEEVVVHLPAGPGACVGTLSAVPAGSSVSADGRTAWLRAAGPAGESAAIVLRYDVGSAGCPPGTWTGLPPFFVEAPPGDAAFAVAMLGDRLGEPR